MEISMFKSSRLTQLKIYYLFAHADGELSAYEKRQLDDIAKKMEMPESSLERYRTFCKEVDLKWYISDAQTVIKEIDKVLEDDDTWFGGIDYDKEEQSLTVWTLINLGYADREYSMEERKVVDYLLERWKLNSTLVDEFNDTANTLLALTLHKEWITSSSKPYLEVDRIVQELNRSIASMFANIETTISEVEIA